MSIAVEPWGPIIALQKVKRIRSGVRFVALFVATSVALMTLACLPQQRRSITAQEPGDSGEALPKRAERFWTAKTAEDWATVFVFEPPDRRAETKEADFVAWCREHEPFRIHSFQLGRVVTEGQVGWVEVDYSTSLSRFPDLAPREAGRWQKWLLVDGQWYPISPRQLSLYPESPALRDGAQEQRLAVRFEEAWRARRDRDWHQLYKLTDPRDWAEVPEDDFVEVESLFEYLSYELGWVQVLGEDGKVRVAYRHKVSDPSLTKLPARSIWLVEKWIKYDNEWYRDLK